MTSNPIRQQELAIISLMFRCSNLLLTLSQKVFHCVSCKPLARNPSGMVGSTPNEEVRPDPRIILMMVDGMLSDETSEKSLFFFSISRRCIKIYEGKCLAMSTCLKRLCR